MPDIEFLTVLSLGFLLGARHALDADHVAAVSTLLSRHPNLHTSGLIGFSWGLGHTVVLLLVGIIVILLKITIPEPLARACEFGVGVMLVALGGSLAWTLYRERWHVHPHRHDESTHMHLHSHRLHADHGHDHWLKLSLRPFLVGMAHGLAGSAALTLAVLSAIRTLWEGIAYIVVFGIGSIIGMTLLGFLISLPLILSASVGRRTQRAIQAVASVGSIGLGLAMMVRTGLGESLF
jgi:ABC-type nickel/cobalt efflux system permease component RcnA